MADTSARQSRDSDVDLEAARDRLFLDAEHALRDCDLTVVMLRATTHREARVGKSARVLTAARAG